MQIKCDHCGPVVASIEPACAKDGDLEYNIFCFPDCKAVYPIAVTAMRLRADIAAYQHKRNYIHIHPVTEQFLRDTEALKQDNLKRCTELMEQHPLALFLENHADILERLERETE